MNAPDTVHPITLQNRRDLCGKRLGVSLEVYIGLQRHAFFPDQSLRRKRTPSLRGNGARRRGTADFSQRRGGMGKQSAGRSGRIDVMRVIVHQHYEPDEFLYVKNKMGPDYFYVGGGAQGNRIWPPFLSPAQRHPSRSSEAIALCIRGLGLWLRSWKPDAMARPITSATPPQPSTLPPAQTGRWTWRSGRSRFRSGYRFQVANPLPRRAG
jgi:hypothetical protein